MIDAIAGRSRAIAFYGLIGFIFSSTFSIALSQMLMGGTIFFALISLLSREQRKYPSGFKWFYIAAVSFVVWSLVSSLLGPTPVKSLLINKEEWLFIIIPVTAYLITDEKRLRLLLKALAVSLILISLYAVFQHFSGIDLYHHFELPNAPWFGYRVNGTFSNRLTFGNLFAVAAALLLPVAPILESPKWKTVFYTAFALSALAVVFTYGRGPILALAFGIILYAVIFSRRHVKSLIILVGTLVVLVASMAPDIISGYEFSAKKEWEGKHPSSRIAIWKTTARMAAAHPLLGVGQGNFEEQYRYYRAPHTTKTFSHGHNDLLNIAAYAGVPGAVLYISMWLTMIFLMLKKMKGVEKGNLVSGAMVGILLASVVFFVTSGYEATFADEEVRQFLMALWGGFIGCAGIVKSRGKTAD